MLCLFHASIQFDGFKLDLKKVGKKTLFWAKMSHFYEYPKTPKPQVEKVGVMY